MIPVIGETSAQFARISFHRGKKQAYVAVAHSMLIAIYHIIKDCVILKEERPDKEYEQGPLLALYLMYDKL